MSTRLKRINICKHCGKSYNPYYKEQLYCSEECATPHRGEKRRRSIERTCLICRKKFFVRAYRTSAKYCSRECWSKRNPPITKECPACGKTFTTYKSQNHSACSKKCAYKINSDTYRGPNSSAWKGGKSLKNERGQDSGKLRKWRKDVYTRDNYTCRKCGYKGKLLHSHHIKPYSKFPDLRFDVDNGITLCINCHEKEHKRKLSSPSKYPKHCIDCGKETSGKGYRCQKCAGIYPHILKGHKIHAQVERHNQETSEE